MTSACGGGGGGGPDASDVVDALPPCGEELCAALSEPCGAGIDSCGGEVDCGSCNYDSEVVGTVGVAPAIDVGRELVVAYVETAPPHEVRLAERYPFGWASETVAVLDGPPLGPVDVAVALDGTRWITFIDDLGKLRIATAAEGGLWAISEPLGACVAAAIAVDVEGNPVVAISGTIETRTGMFVLTLDGSEWSSVPIGAPATLAAAGTVALAVRADEISLAWRDPGDQILRHASGKGTTFAIEIVDPAVAPPRDPRALSLAIDPGGRPHVVYGRGGQLVHAVRGAELWDRQALPFDSADGDDALAIGVDGVVRAAVFDAGGLRVLEGVGGVFLSQVVSSRCTDGSVDTAVAADGTLHVVEACADGIQHLRRAGPL
jgi:hypothetical protein